MSKPPLLKKSSGTIKPLDRGMKGFMPYSWGISGVSIVMLLNKKQNKLYMNIFSRPTKPNSIYLIYMYKDGFGIKYPTMVDLP